MRQVVATMNLLHFSIYQRDKHSTKNKILDPQDDVEGLICGSLNPAASTHFNPMFHFYTPWKRQKAKGFLTFSRGIEMEDWAKMG